MRQGESFFKGLNNYNIYFQQWTPDGTPKAVLLIAHGYAEHSGRYMNVVNKLTPAGYMIYAADHRGHGKSEGYRGYVKSMHDFVQDNIEFTDIIKNKEGEDIPIFLLGHSMGVFIAISLAIENSESYRAVILSAAGSEAGEGANWFLKAMAGPPSLSGYRRSRKTRERGILSSRVFRQC